MPADDSQNRLKTRAWFSLNRLNRICRDTYVRILQGQHGEDWLTKFIEQDFEVKPPLHQNTIKEICSLKKQNGWEFSPDFFEIKHLARMLKSNPDSELFNELFHLWAFSDGKITKGPNPYFVKFLVGTLFKCNSIRALVMHQSGIISSEEVKYLDNVVSLLQMLIIEKIVRPGKLDSFQYIDPKAHEQWIRDIVYATCGIPGGVPIDTLRDYYVYKAIERGKPSEAAIKDFADILDKLRDSGDLIIKSKKIFLVNSLTFWGAIPELRRIDRALQFYETQSNKQQANEASDPHSDLLIENSDEPIPLDPTTKEISKAEVEKLVKYQRSFFCFVCEKALKSIENEIIESLGIEPESIYFDCIVNGPSYYINQFYTDPLGLVLDKREWLKNHLENGKYPSQLLFWLGDLDDQMRQLERKVAEVVTKFQSETIIYLEGSISLCGRAYGTNLFEYDNDAVFLHAIS